jgi:hypothetical protein
MIEPKIKTGIKPEELSPKPFFLLLGGARTYVLIGQLIYYSELDHIDIVKMS